MKYINEVVCGAAGAVGGDWNGVIIMAENGVLNTTLTLQMEVGYSSYVPRLSCTQTDNQSIKVVLKMMNRQVPYIVPEGYEVNLRAEKPDRTHVYKPVALENGVYSFILGGQLTTAVGVAKCAIEVVKGVFVLNSALFDIEVKPQTAPDADIISENDLETLNWYVSRAESAANRAETSETNAAASAAEAKKSETAAVQSALNAESAQKAAESAKTQAVESAANADKSAQKAAQSEQNAAKSAADAAKSSGKIPDPTAEDAGKALIVKSDGTGYEFGSSGAEIADDKIQKSTTWSSQKIIDTLAPAFEVSGPIVTCNPIEGYPLSVVASIEPIQEGEGDPSPDNVRPIRGWTEANLWVAGKNLWDNDYALNPDNWEHGTYYALRLPLAPNATYTLSMSKNNMFKNYNPDYNGKFALYLGEIPNQSAGNTLIGNANVSDVPLTCTFSTSDKPMYANLYVDTYGASGFEIAFTELLVNLQIEAGSTPTPYTPYNPASKTITLPFGQTVYGGTLDWNAGVLTVTHAEIASYSGESLPGVWISDRDVYSQGATPTTGAQVVYELAQPQTIQLTPQEILALSGVNTIYADTGNVTVSGRADPTATVNSLMAEIEKLKASQAGLQSVQDTMLGIE